MIINVEPDIFETGEGEKVKRWLKKAAELIGGDSATDEGDLVWVIREYRDGAFHAIAAATTRRTKDAVEVTRLGGERARDWVHQLDNRIAAFAKLEGCSFVRAYGRKGWERLLGSHIMTTQGDTIIYERRL